MKPHIYLCQKLWVCALRGTRSGYGFFIPGNPMIEGARQAYSQWASQNPWWVGWR